MHAVQGAHGASSPPGLTTPSKPPEGVPRTMPCMVGATRGTMLDGPTALIRLPVWVMPQVGRRLTLEPSIIPQIDGLLHCCLGARIEMMSAHIVKT